MDNITANKLVTEIFRQSKDKHETCKILDNIFGANNAPNIWEQAVLYKKDELIDYLKKNHLYPNTPSLKAVQDYIDDLCEESVGIFDDVEDNLGQFTTDLFWRVTDLFEEHFPSVKNGDDDLYHYLSNTLTYSDIYEIIAQHLNNETYQMENVLMEFLNKYPECKTQPTQVVESNYEEGFELLSFNTTGFANGEMVFAILYTNEPSIKVIKGITPRILKRYDLPQEHIEFAGTLLVGQSYSFSNYTLVRLN